VTAASQVALELATGQTPPTARRFLFVAREIEDHSTWHQVCVRRAALSGCRQRCRLVDLLDDRGAARAAVAVPLNAAVMMCAPAVSDDVVNDA